MAQHKYLDEQGLSTLWSKIKATFAYKGHTHGNITSGGTITADTAIQNGAKIVITDTNDKVSRSPITFRSSGTTKALTEAGTWVNFQAPIDSAHKISADNVDDTNTTNKFVTTEDIEAWDEHINDTSGRTPTSGFFKISVSNYGHIVGTTGVTKSDITGLGIPGEDTHYTAKNIINASTADTAQTSSLISNPRLNLVENETGTDKVRSSHQFSGAGYTQISGSSNGVITINTEVPNAVPSVNNTGGTPGLMSATDKEKLDQLAGGGSYAPNRLANGSSSGVVYTTSSVSTNTGYVATPIINGIPYYQDIHATVEGHYNPITTLTSYEDISLLIDYVDDTHARPIKSGDRIIGGIQLSADTNGHIVMASAATFSIGLVSGSSTTNGEGGPKSAGPGLMSVEDKDKLDSIQSGATPGTTYNGHYTPGYENTNNRFTGTSITSTTTTTGNVVTSITYDKDGKGHILGLSANTMALGMASNSVYGLVSTDSTVSTTASTMTPAPIVDGKIYYQDTNTTKSGHYTPTLHASDIAHKIQNSGTFVPGDTVATLVSISSDTKGHIVLTQLSGKTLDIVSAAANASGGTDGLMSWEDKAKLDRIVSGAQVNVIESIQIGSTTIGPNGLTNKNANITTALDDYIGQKIAATIIPKGTVSSVPALSGSAIGWMYNISAPFTITSDFVEYDSEVTKTYPAGTNIYVINTADEGEDPVKKWDVLAGFVDLSDYVERNELTAYTTVLYAESAYMKLSGMTAYVQEADMVPITDAYINALS